jgi:Cu-Zn family superoxide dismutase
MIRLSSRLVLLTALLILTSLAPVGMRRAAALQSPERRFPSRYILPGEAVFPEGVAANQVTGFFYVSSTTDGTIFRGHVLKEMTQVFLPGGQDGRTTAVGLALDRHHHRLFIVGGATGQVFIYNALTGALVASFDNQSEVTFLNDVDVAQSGEAYVTDSLDPVLYRVSATPAGGWTLDPWLDLTGTPIEYQEGFNLNGIVVTPNDKYLIVVQSNTGKLFRITIATQEVVEIDLDGESVPNGDGILLRGHTLYVVQNQDDQIAIVRLSGDFSGGEVISRETDPSFDFPTTIARAWGRLLVVNSQFDKPEEPDLPFNVSGLPLGRFAGN